MKDTSLAIQEHLYKTTMQIMLNPISSTIMHARHLLACRVASAALMVNTLLASTHAVQHHLWSTLVLHNKDAEETLIFPDQLASPVKQHSLDRFLPNLVREDCTILGIIWNII